MCGIQREADCNKCRDKIEMLSEFAFALSYLRSVIAVISKRHLFGCASEIVV